MNLSAVDSIWFCVSGDEIFRQILDLEGKWVWARCHCCKWSWWALQKRRKRSNWAEALQSGTGVKHVSLSAQVCLPEGLVKWHLCPFMVKIKPGYNLQEWNIEFLCKQGSGECVCWRELNRLRFYIWAFMIHTSKRHRSWNEATSCQMWGWSLLSAGNILTLWEVDVRFCWWRSWVVTETLKFVHTSFEMFKHLAICLFARAYQLFTRRVV